MEYKGRTRMYRGPEGASLNFDDVVPDKVTIRDISPKPYVYAHVTPFVEVDIVPYVEPPEITKFLNNMEVCESSLEKIFNSVVESIEEYCDPGKLHVIGASSGYDSRIIAKAIQILRKKNGEEWFGYTMFVENGGESEGFLAIMKDLDFLDHAESWHPKYGVKYFNNMHEKFNGICSYPINQWYDYYVNYGLNEEDSGQCDTMRDVDYVIGAALAIKRKTLNEIGRIPMQQ